MQKGLVSQNGIGRIGDAEGLIAMAKGNPALSTLLIAAGSQELMG
jgi:hypothetical protein